MTNPYQAPQHINDRPPTEMHGRNNMWWPFLFAVAAIIASNIAYRWPIYDANGSVELANALIPWIPIFVLLVLFALMRSRR